MKRDLVPSSSPPPLFAGITHIRTHQHSSPHEAVISLSLSSLEVPCMHAGIQEVRDTSERSTVPGVAERSGTDWQTVIDSSLSLSLPITSFSLMCQTDITQRPRLFDILVSSFPSLLFNPRHTHIQT